MTGEFFSFGLIASPNLRLVYTGRISIRILRPSFPSLLRAALADLWSLNGNNFFDRRFIIMISTSKRRFYRLFLFWNVFQKNYRFKVVLWRTFLMWQKLQAVMAWHSYCYNAKASENSLIRVKKYPFSKILFKETNITQATDKKLILNAKFCLLLV